MFKRNKTMKKIMAFITVFVMSFSILQPVLAQDTIKAVASVEVEQSGFEFKDGVITGYNGSEKDLIIPEKINGQDVTEIGNKIFFNKGLTSVKFPSTLKKIGNMAFSKNKLTSVDFPKNLKVIDKGTFLGNSINKVNFNEGLEEIGDNAFTKCPIEELVIPGSVKKIGARAFNGGGQLKKLEIREGVQHIGRMAFQGNALTSVSIPNSVTNIDDVAFSKNKISQVDLGEKLERIGFSAFEQNQLKSLKIPESLKNFCWNSFENNPGEDGKLNLYLSKTIRLDLGTSKEEAINKLNENLQVYVNSSKENVGFSSWEFEAYDGNRSGQYKAVGVYKPFSEELTGAKANEALENLRVIANIELEKVKVEDEKSWLAKDFKFKDTTLLGFSQSGKEKFKNNKDLIIPQKNKEGKIITTIGTGAFWSDVHTKDKDKITSLKLPNTIEVIEARAFGGNLLKSLDIPKSVKSIGDGAFASNQISDMELKEGLVSIGELSFGINELTELIIPTTLRKIGHRAFFQNKINKITILPGIEKIGDQCFENNKIEKVDLPDTVKAIDLGGFLYNSIKNVKFPKGMKVIGPKAFGINDLESVTIPDSVELICPNSFRKNKGFESGEFKIFIDKVIELEGNFTEDEMKERLDKEVKVRAAVFRGLIDEEKHKINLKSWEKIEEENGYLIFRGKFDPVPVDKIKCGSGTSCENTVENMKMTSLIVKVKLNGKFIQSEKPAEPSKPEQPEKPAESEKPVDPEKQDKEAWEAKHFTFAGTAVTGFSELGKKKFAKNKEVVIPEKTIDGKVVDGIGDEAFNLDKFGQDGIKSLTLPNTIKRICEMAFRNNNIVNLVLPDSVEELGKGAFAANRDLKTLKLSNKLKSISQGAFSHSKIAKLVIPEGVTAIYNSAFTENKLLSDVSFPSTLVKIDDRAFWNSVIVELTIPGNVKEIGSDAFTGSKISSLILEEGIENIGNRAFKRNKLSEVIIPKSVTKLNKTVFERNPSINVRYASLIDILEKAEKINTEGKPQEKIEVLQEAVVKGKKLDKEILPELEKVNSVVKEIQEAINELADKPSQPEKPSKPISIKDIKKTVVGNKIEVTISATTKEAIKGVVVIKPVNKKGRAYKVVYKENNFKSGENEIKIELNSSNYSKGIKDLKVYVWDDLENMMPLADVKSIGV